MDLRGDRLSQLGGSRSRDPFKKDSSRSGGRAPARRGSGDERDRSRSKSIYSDDSFGGLGKSKDLRSTSKSKRFLDSPRDRRGSTSKYDSLGKSFKQEDKLSYDSASDRGMRRRPS